MTHRCVICDTPIIRNPRPHSKPVKSCSPECRLELRRRVGRETADRKAQAKVYTRECLRCGEEFKAPDKFTRICFPCHDRNHVFGGGCDWWGGVV